MKRTPMNRRIRNTGPAKDVREKVYKRDQSRCALCGTADGPFSIHHRLPRGRGGDNRLSNLVLLCDFGGCHDTVVESARARSTLNGWLVQTGKDPAEVPLVHHGEWVYLRDDGSLEPVGASACEVDGCPRDADVSVAGSPYCEAHVS